MDFLANAAFVVTLLAMWLWARWYQGRQTEEPVDALTMDGPLAQADARTQPHADEPEQQEKRARVDLPYFDSVLWLWRPAFVMSWLLFLFTSGSDGATWVAALPLVVMGMVTVAMFYVTR